MFEIQKYYEIQISNFSKSYELFSYLETELKYHFI